ncbi:MAG: YraN family protein [Dehalococcoidia bacterium]
MTARQRLGAFGERLARRHIETAGLTVVATNIRLKAGEIDILAHDAGDLVFIEARTRKAPPGSAAETLTPAKLRRLWACAMEYCEREQQNPESVRLDLVCIDLDDSGRVAAIEHIKGLEVPD